MDSGRDADEPPVLVTPRDAAAWAEMGLVTQANLVALVVQQCRRAGVTRDAHEIRTPPPGVVRACRDRLIPVAELNEMTDQDLGARCRVAWGQLSAFCWLFGGRDPNRPPDFHAPPPSPRCAGEIALRVEWVVRTLWRLRFEQHLRLTPNFRLRPDFHDLKLAAGRIEATVYDRPVHTAPLEWVIMCACETSGVLAALRWALDDRWAWDQAGISDVGLE